VAQRFLILPIYCFPLILSVLVLSFFLTGEIFAQPSNSQDAISKTDNLTGEKLDRMIELLEQSRQGSQIALYLTIIVFMTGLAFVVFGLYIGQEHKLSLFTKRLYILAYFSLIVPVTFIILRYIVNTVLSGGWDNPVLIVAYLLMIPITASYILMVIKVKHDVIKSPPS
jgi:cellulose synthase/poly-beta-1,6-N-acetylglucosamine synthase-like glycosyltransferase